MLSTLSILLARLLANSTSSGFTPSALTTLFGPSLYGVGAGIGTSLFSLNPTATANARSGRSSYDALAGNLQSCHATEDSLLSFVPLQVSQITPRQLVTWVQGHLPHCERDGESAWVYSEDSENRWIYRYISNLGCLRLHQQHPLYLRRHYPRVEHIATHCFLYRRRCHEVFFLFG